MASPRQYQNVPMEFKRSVPHPIEAFETDPDFPYTFRPRMSDTAHLTADACWTCRDDLKKAGWKGSLAVGCLNDISGHFVAAVFPEGLADKFDPLSYLSEYAFIHDERADEAYTAEEFEEAHQTMYTFIDKSESDPSNSMLKSIQARMVLELYKGNPDAANRIMGYYKGLIGIKSPERDVTSYKTFDDYLVWRFVDGGGPIYLEMMRYTLDFSLTNDDIAPLEHIISTLMNATVLSNDYYSWPKEYEHYMRTGGTMPLVNAVSVLKHFHGIDDNTKALELLRERILKYERQYCELRDEYIRKENPGANVIRFFGYLELGTAGTRFWHATSKRYNKSAPAPVRRGERPASHSEDVSSNGIHVDKTAKIESNNSVGRHDMVNTPEAERIENGISNGISNGKNFDPFSLGKSGDDKIAMEPYKYVSSLPASGSRDALLDALNCFYSVPDKSFAIIRQVVGIIHNASLMLDDVEDNSPVRRGHPSVHIVFGISQTINSATYQYVNALRFVTALKKETIGCFIHTLSQLHIGQSHDLYWTFHCSTPNVDEYFQQTEDKTGGLFRMAAGMMRAEATQNQDLDTDKLMKILGKYYQLRDDYNDLVPVENQADKYLNTVYNDLDQGSFTLPIIHALQKQVQNGDTKLLSILRSRNQHGGKMSAESKKLAVKIIEEAGSFAYTKSILQDLHMEMEREIELLEKKAGMGENWIFRLMLYRLKI